MTEPTSLQMSIPPGVCQKECMLNINIQNWRLLKAVNCKLWNVSKENRWCIWNNNILSEMSWYCKGNL